MKSQFEGDPGQSAPIRRAYYRSCLGMGLKRRGTSPALILILALLLSAIASNCRAQQATVPSSQMVDEPLSEQVNDPLAHLSQIQIKNPYTPAEYGTNAQPNTVQIRSIFAIRPWLLIPVEQRFRPTI